MLYIAVREADGSGMVYAYSLGDLAKPALKLGKTGSAIGSLSFNSAGDLAVSSAAGVELYKAGSDKPSGRITGFEPRDAIYDTGGYLCVADYANNRVKIFPPNSTSPSIEITDGIDRPSALAIDAKNNLYVGSNGSVKLDGDHVTVYDENGTSPFRTITKTPFPRRLLVGSNGDVYAETRFGGDVLVVKAGRTEASDVIRTNASDIAISP